MSCKNFLFYILYYILYTWKRYILEYFTIQTFQFSVFSGLSSFSSRSRRFGHSDVPVLPDTFFTDIPVFPVSSGLSCYFRRFSLCSFSRLSRRSSLYRLSSVSRLSPVSSVFPNISFFPDLSRHSRHFKIDRLKNWLAKISLTTQKNMIGHKKTDGP